MVGTHVLKFLSDESVAKVWVQHLTAIWSPNKWAGCIQKDNQVMRQLGIQTGTHLHAILQTLYHWK
jgi:hypothetical protein